VVRYYLLVLGVLGVLEVQVLCYPLQPVQSPQLFQLLLPVQLPQLVRLVLVVQAPYCLLQPVQLPLVDQLSQLILGVLVALAVRVPCCQLPLAQSRQLVQSRQWLQLHLADLLSQSVLVVQLRQLVQYCQLRRSVQLVLVALAVRALYLLGQLVQLVLPVQLVLSAPGLDQCQAMLNLPAMSNHDRCRR
jgi:hypothetical protein